MCSISLREVEVMENKCPVCGEEAEYTCKCLRGDSVCKNNHKWHRCAMHKKIVVGHSNHAIPMDVCTCGEGNRGSGDI